MRRKRVKKEKKRKRERDMYTDKEIGERENGERRKRREIKINYWNRRERREKKRTKNKRKEWEINIRKGNITEIDGRDKRKDRKR